MPDPNFNPDGAAFTTTRWSLVLRAAGNADDEAQSRAALESLCRAYWQPLYFFVRRQGHSPEAAEDFTQELFTLIAGGEILQKVQPERGKFRSYLLGVMKHVMARAREKESTAKRGGRTVKLSLDGMEAEERYLLCPVDHESPEVLFDRRWAETVMARALERLATDYAAAGHAGRFAILQTFLVTGERGASYEQTAAALGVTEAGARSAVFKLRQRFAEVLHAEVGETVANAAEAEDELRYLAKVLGS